ncbi:MAG: iron transporter [Clostridiales Family XIII bacterium]|jgi:uncharacterized protein involved in high-affinity Fe2+ transport|nr:iron transporter [Clostridiales Family XIII bacterium]
MKSKKTLILAAAVSLTLFGFTACGGGGGSATGDGGDAPAGDVGPGGVAGFTEYPIGDDIELGPLNVAGVYFQPVDMEPVGMGLAAADSDFHIEADISALEGNDLGYGAGDFVPWLTVDYEIEDAAGNMAANGTFMPMSASDGPHYGANIKLGDAGTYTVRFSIENPEVNGYLLHTDALTGVEGRFWNGPLVAEWEFDYVPIEW